MNNGYTDHVHCLISLKSDQTTSKIMQLIKGESAFWINQQKLTNSKFGWQDEYFGISVSESQLNRVKNYIRNHEVHHQKKSFSEEYDLFINRLGFAKLDG